MGQISQYNYVALLLLNVYNDNKSRILFFKCLED